MGINRGGKTMNRDGQLLYTVARLYYLDNLNQAEISAEMGLSRRRCPACSPRRARTGS